MPEVGPEDPSLPPGAGMTLPLWIRADKAGAFTMDLVFEYSSVALPARRASGAASVHSLLQLQPTAGAAAATKQPLRTLALSRPLVVLPALHVNVFTRPSLRSLDQHVLGVEVENLTDQPVDVHALTLLSPTWALDAGSGGALVPGSEPLVVQPKSSHYLYLTCVGNQQPVAELSESPELKTTRALEAVVLENAYSSVDFGPMDMTLSTRSWVGPVALLEHPLPWFSALISSSPGLNPARPPPPPAPTEGGQASPHSDRC